MELEFKSEAPTLTLTPNLTFDAAPVPAVAPAAAPAVQPEKPKEEIPLTPEEQAQVEAFSKQIDLSNSTAILNYGVGAQMKLSQFTEKELSAIRTKDTGEVGEMITNLIGELKGFEIDEKEKGLKALFKKGGNRLTVLKAKYAKVETNVNVITTELEKHEATLLKDVAMLDQMYAANLAYFKELTMYIAAGKKKLEETRKGELDSLQNKAKESGLAEDVQAAKDLAAMCDRFEKKIYDLQLTRTVALQTAPQIRTVQASDTMVDWIFSAIIVSEA